MLATLCDLAGIAAPESSEGLSFKPVLTGQKQTVRDVLYGVYNGGTKPGMRSVKQGDWKLIKYDVMNGSVRETQFFNLKDNPNELLIEHHDAKVVALTDATPTKHQVNLAGDPQYADKLAEMEALLLGRDAPAARSVAVMESTCRRSHAAARKSTLSSGQMKEATAMTRI